MSEDPFNRKRSTSTLANTISFTHTRGGGEEDRQQSNKPTSPFGYLNRNGSSSTIHSITHTLSNVGFNSVNPSIHSPESSTNSVTSPTLGKRENALTRAKLFARNKTKELKKTRDTDRPHHSHHHHNFLKINSHHGLSSSSSNSKVLDSGSTLYSFDPSNIIDNDVMKHVVSDANLKGLSFEEKDQIADNLWTTITSTVLPLFKLENSSSLKLKTPIEDVNKMVEVFLRLRIENKTTATSLISDVQELLKNGLNIMENELTFNENSDQGSPFHRLAITWEYFFANVYHYLLAIFLPLQLEFEGIGPIVKNAKEYWSDISEPSVTQSTKKVILSAFRDYVVIPYFDTELSVQDVEDSERRTLVQCFGILQSIHSANYNQRIIEHLSSILQQNLAPLKVQ